MGETQFQVPARPARSAGPGRPRSPEAHRAILVATRELLAAFGYGAMTVDAIAKRAGVGKATIYRHWPSKAQLAVGTLAMSPPLCSRQRAHVEDDLVALLREFVRLARETPLGAVLPALLAERSRDAELAASLDPLIRERIQPFEAAVARATARGELPRALDPRLAVQLLIGPVLSGLFFGEGRTDPRAIRSCVRAAIAGIRSLADPPPRGGSR